LKNSKSHESISTNHHDLEPPLLLAILGFCLGISDWMGLQLIGAPAFSLLITPQLYGMMMGFLIGLGLFILFFRKKRTHTELVLMTRIIFRLLLLFLVFTITLGALRNDSPAFLLFLLGTELGVISGILIILVWQWYS
jgi:hypothetical protein